MKKFNHKILLPICHIMASAYTVTAGTKEEPFAISAVVAENSTTAYVKITGRISEWSSASSRDLERIIDALVIKGAINADIYLNGPGGSTIEAVEIVNTLRKFKGKLIGYGGSIVASAYSFIACKLDEFHVSDNTQYMYHRPKGYVSGNYDEILSGAALFKNTEADYVATYVAKSIYTSEEIVANWSKGDQWLMGKEIVKAGFADKLTEKSVQVSALDVSMIEACGAPVVPKITVKHQNSNKVERTQIITALGLDANATDADITAAVAKNKADAKAYTDGKAKRESDAQAEETSKITALVDGAIKAKKITADQKDNYIKLATADYDVTKETLDAIVAVEKPAPKTGATSVDASKKDWTLKEYQEKDPEAFVALLDSDPELAAKLEKEHYA